MTTQVSTDVIANNSVTFAKVQTTTANRLIGSDGSGNVAVIALGSGLSLSSQTLTATAGSALGQPVAFILLNNAML